MNVKVFDENNQLAHQYFDVSVEIDYQIHWVSIFLYGTDNSLKDFSFKKLLISQDEKEIIIYVNIMT